ncbi:MAG: cobalamin-binding protein [Chitinophagia bacterium]|nr:cobalamin-binding protein [Chitinophagia bacterium]
MEAIREKDALGCEVNLSGPARRIVSLVPSQTELLHDLGLDAEVVGITRFCVHPPHWRRTKTRIGGTKDVRVERICSLAPDLVIANREENVKEQVEAIRSFCPVWTSDVNDLADATEMIRSVGRLTGREAAAGSMAQSIIDAFAASGSVEESIRTAYLIWRDPWMAAGGDTFIHDMMRRCGFSNVFADRPRYPVTTLSELSQAGVELVLLSSEPYPFRERDLEAVRRALPRTEVRLVDGEMFSWYGSRLRESARYLMGMSVSGRG